MKVTKADLVEENIVLRTEILKLKEKLSVVNNMFEMQSRELRGIRDAYMAISGCLENRE